MITSPEESFLNLSATERRGEIIEPHALRLPPCKSVDITRSVIAALRFEIRHRHACVS